MNRPARNYFPGQRAPAKPPRSQTERMLAANDHAAVLAWWETFPGGENDSRRGPRLNIAARLVTTDLANTTGSACSVTSKGPGAEVFAIRRGSRDA